MDSRLRGQLEHKYKDKIGARCKQEQNVRKPKAFSRMSRSLTSSKGRGPRGGRVESDPAVVKTLFHR